MNKETYKYSILKYNHSQLLDEQLNVGILFYFEDSKKFAFRYSKNLKRLKSVYENISSKVIQHYLQQIDKKIAFINTQSNFISESGINDIDDFISNRLISPDAGSLQFSKIFKGFSLNEDSTSIIDFLWKSYFSQKNIKLKVKAKPSISETFFELVNSKIDIDFFRKEHKILKEYKVLNKTGKTYVFDYAWQNGTLNLVKPLSFDLKTSAGIEEKAHKNLGLFIDLENEAFQNNLKYDILVSMPTNKDFYKDYDHALKLLEIPKHLEIIEEKDILEYSQKAIAALSQSKP